ncbi:MAG: proline--tRNA ligase [Oscillospiraceae bacterium]|jgi:prolyl-tRNA synthetase|nr:proline--tRNA ligase [Oscillospiraceae bacterium]
MSNQEKMVKEITAMEEDFAKWYTDIVKKAQLMDYSSVRGCMVLEPHGFAIWENIQKILDKKFKDLGHQNVALPLLIPESLLQKEREHIEGFAPEVAWVTHAGNEKLQERLCIRPTSEVLFCEYFSRKVHSWRDLPKLYNQWCNIVRWEKTTRPFLRTVEFHWQEGHTIHETKEEAKNETMTMLGIYADFCKNELCMPIISGRKTDKEKFAGAEETYTIEAMMHDGKTLQSATSHYFGDGFSKAFDITYQDRNNKPSHPYETSFGMSTRIIGGIIMTHGDNNGLVLPPDVAPIQIIIIPISMNKAGVLEKAKEIYEVLKEKYKVALDTSDQTPGWKFAEYEMKGVPIRLEIGPNDIKKSECVLVRRDNREKSFVPFANLNDEIDQTFIKLKKALYEKALSQRNNLMREAKTKDDFNKICSEKHGFIKSMWCGEKKCEEILKEELAVSSRCISLTDDKISDKCAVCGKEAKHLVYWGKAY